jgi:CDP-glycerol glycerophosphotransferase
VTLLGQIENPHFFLNSCDCFVFSSNYEGQGLVLLEALVICKPIISTNIPTSIDVLDNGRYGELVENSVDGLIYGMEKYIKGELTGEKFDSDGYVKEAMDMFYDKLK